MKNNAHNNILGKRPACVIKTCKNQFLRLCRKENRVTSKVKRHQPNIVSTATFSSSASLSSLISTVIESKSNTLSVQNPPIHYGPTLARYPFIESKNSSEKSKIQLLTNQWLVQYYKGTNTSRWNTNHAHLTTTNDTYYNDDNNMTSLYKNRQNTRAQNRRNHVSQSQLLKQMEDFLSVPIGSVHPREISSQCQDLMTKLCKNQTVEDLSRATDLLHRLLREKRHTASGTPNQQPHMIVSEGLFHIVMFGWAKISLKLSGEGPRRTKEILDLMMEENDYDIKKRDGGAGPTPLPREDDDEDVDNGNAIGQKDGRMITCQPSVKSYNILLTALANASRLDPKRAPKQAELLLQTMSDHHTKRGWHTKPNSRSWTLVIKAYADSRTFDAGRNAERILNRMKDVHKEELIRYDDDHSVTATEEGDGIGGISHYDLEDESNNVRKIVTPDRVAYTLVISAYANCGRQGSAEQAEKILFEMLQSGSDGEDGSRLQPDAISFTSTIQAWVQAMKKIKDKKRRFEAADRSERILHMMKDLAAQWEVENGEGASTFQENDIIKDATRKPEQPINVNPFIPTVATYNAVLNAWAQSDCRDAAPRAEELLHMMIDDSQPDRSSFHTLMNAWARSGNHTKAEELISVMYEMDDSQENGGSIKPITQTYSIAINAWAKSEEIGKGGVDNGYSNNNYESNNKAANARRLFDIMLDKYEAGDEGLKPNIFAYTAVLSAAANSLTYTSKIHNNNDNENSSNNTHDPFGIAIRTFNEIKEDVYNLRLQPDHFVYAIMLKVVLSHTAKSSDERRRWVETIFDDACAKGQVSSLVIRNLRDACPGDLFERLVGRKKSSPNTAILPRTWTQNVRHNKRIHTVELNRSTSRSKRSGGSRLRRVQ